MNPHNEGRLASADVKSARMDGGGYIFHRLTVGYLEDGKELTYGSNYSNPSSNVYLGDGVSLPGSGSVLRLKTYDQTAGGVYVMARAESGGTIATHTAGWTSTKDPASPPTSDVLVSVSGGGAYANLASADGGTANVTARYEVYRDLLSDGESITVYLYTAPDGSSAYELRSALSYGAGSGNIAAEDPFSAVLAAGADVYAVVVADVDPLKPWWVKFYGSASSTTGVSYTTYGSPSITAITSADAKVRVETKEAG